MSVQPPRKIMIAIDGSPSSMYAIDWFSEWFIKARDDVILFHCKESPSLTQFFRASSSKSESSTKPNSEELLKNLEELVSNSRYKCSVLSLQSNRPGEIIVHACEHHKIDILILGARGTRPVTKRTTVGSVADYVMQNIKIPTLICQLPPVAKRESIVI